MSIASLIGVLVGGVAGYRGGMTDEVLMRFTDFFLVIPMFVVILAVTAYPIRRMRQESLT